MFIECPSCKSRAQIPESKEGAKVRCPECGRVYVARPVGARGKAQRSTVDPTRYVLIGGGLVVLAIVGVMVSRADRRRAPAEAAGPATAAEEPSERSATGWDSALVQLAVGLHDQVERRSLVQLLTAVDFARAHEWHTARAASGAEEAVDSSPAGPAWATLDEAERRAFQDALVEAMTEGEYRELLADWVPYDGFVAAEDDQIAVVRLRVHHRSEPSTPDRSVEWRLARDGGRWRAWAWERWLSPEELRAARASKTKTVKRTLSDGSVVIEGEVRSEIDYHPDTPPELVTEIEGAIDRLIDPLASPKDLTAARERLREIGKHAVPGLLKRLGSVPMDSEDNLIALNQIHLLLQDLTGYVTTFDVHVAMGTTEERQDSGLKQWFGWYDKKFKRYWTAADEVAEDVDPLWDDPDFQPRTEKERREFEKLRAERAAARQDD